MFPAVPLEFSEQQVRIDFDLYMHTVDQSDYYFLLEMLSWNEIHSFLSIMKLKNTNRLTQLMNSGFESVKYQQVLT